MKTKTVDLQLAMSDLQYAVDAVDPSQMEWAENRIRQGLLEAVGSELSRDPSVEEIAVVLQCARAVILAIKDQLH